MSVKAPARHGKEASTQSFREKAINSKKEFKIEIQLKGGSSKNQLLDTRLIKVVENEYAVRYLEQLGLSATQNNINLILKKAPLTTCEL